ncbi:MAG: hypothetical protein ACJAYQ_003826 [Bacteriovoracaceae bacterium]
MKFYLLIFTLLVSCSSIPPLAEKRLSAKRTPASSFHCRELLESVLEGRGLKDEKAYLRGLKKRLARAELSLKDQKYLKEKIPFVIKELKARRVYLKALNRKLQSLRHEYIYKEVYYLESLLMGAPSFQKLNSLNRAVLDGRELSNSQKNWAYSFVNYLQENLNQVKIKKIGKQAPQNSQLAGAQYPPTKLTSDLALKYPMGVWFDEAGFPNFSIYAKQIVEVRITGAGRFDFARANLAAGLERVPDDMTWHHHQDGKTMLLIPKDIHDAVKHSGGVALKTLKIKRINGMLPAGTEWAGRVYPLENWSFRLRAKYPKGVKIKVNGHANLNPYARLKVEITSSGKRKIDFLRANEEAGFDRLPRGYTWHMHEDGKSMQLVPRDLLKAIPITTPWN